MEVTIEMDSGDRDKTVASFCAALEAAFGLPADATRRGVELGFDAHHAALEALDHCTDPEQVGFPASAAAMFTFATLEESHANQRKGITEQACRAAGLLNKLDGLIGEDDHAQVS
jgi:hypothetical protein